MSGLGSFGMGSGIGSFSKASNRKKKLYIKGLDAEKVRDSLWADNNDEFAIDLDVDEFNNLFVKPAEEALAERSKQKAMRRASMTATKKVVLIDMKRAQNAGIALARIRFSHDEIRRKVTDLDDHGFTTDQLRSMEEFLPSPEEAKAIQGFKGDPTTLGLGEHYMLSMVGFETAKVRIRAMLYRQMFRTRVAEIKANLTKVENACDDVKMSGRLRKVLRIILQVVNQLSDEHEKHEGITVESLLKLQNTKAFDKKTSVLQYVISLIYRSDKDPLQFPEDLPYVSDAARISLDSIVSDKSALVEEFDQNFAVVMDIEEKEPTRKTGLMVDFLCRVSEISINSVLFG